MNKSVTLILLFLVSTVFAVEIPTIIIESSKLDEPVLDSSQTVEILDQKKMDSFHIKDVKDLSSTISNTNISGIGSRTNRTFTFRGISNYVAYESSVAMYIDDAPVPFSFGYGVLDMHNINKIEVLKGPQGTQFGKSAESAVINVYTKPTTKTFQSEASVDIGTYNSKDFYGRISGPMNNEDFSYAFSVSKSSNDGFSENLLTGDRIDDRDLTSFSAKLHYNPSTPWDISLNYTKNKANDGGSAFKSDTKNNPYKIDDKPFDDESTMDTDLLSCIIKYKESDYILTSATSYAKQAVLKHSYASAKKGLFIDLDVDIEEFTQELRLRYSFENVDLLIGSLYSKKLRFDYKENMNFYFYHVNSKNILQNPDENRALFTEIKYWFDSHYAMSAGVRYQETERSFKRNLDSIAAESSKKWTHVLPTLSFSYYANDYAHTYFKYAKGYRPGGYNYRAPGTNLVPFEPEITDSFELGHKQKLSSKFSFSGAIFYNDITNHRTVTFDDNLATTVVNAKKAYSYGAELDLSYETEELLLYTSIGVTEAKFKDSDTANTYKNNHLVDVPDMTAAVGATYNLNQNWFVQPSARYMGKRYYDIENTKKEDGYTTVDLSLGYKNLKGFKAVMYVTNLLDKENVDFVIHTPNHNYYHFANPRVFGLKLSKSF
jgi:iron complex outermembrane receptor protein